MESRRLQALHACRLPRRLPDRRALPHRVRHRRRAGGHLQRLRLLRARVPVRRDRPRRPAAAHRGRPARPAAPRQAGGRTRVEVHALLRPPQGRTRAGVREGVPDALDPVRRARRAARARRQAAREAAGRGLERGTALRQRPDDGVGGFGAFFLLLDEPEVYGLPPDPVVPTKHLPAALALDRARRRRARSSGSQPLRRRSQSERTVRSRRSAPRWTRTTGRPIVKEPVWKPRDPVLLLHRRDRGASCVLHGVARLHGNHRLAKLRAVRRRRRASSSRRPCSSPTSGGRSGSCTCCASSRSPRR